MVCFGAHGAQLVNFVNSLEANAMRHCFALWQSDCRCAISQQQGWQSWQQPSQVGFLKTRQKMQA